MRPALSGIALVPQRLKLVEGGPDSALRDLVGLASGSPGLDDNSWEFGAAIGFGE